MKACALLIVLMVAPAAAQTTRSQSAAAGSAGVQSRLQAQGYSGVRDLRRLPSGEWVGRATRNGVQQDVTVLPDSTTIRR